MISFLVADIVQAFYTIVWPMIRISAMLLTAPIFSMKAVNLRVRVIIAIALTITIYPLIEWPMLDPLSSN